MIELRYKAVIFDLDGTLLNTLEDLADSVNEMLSENGYPERTLEEIRKFVGNGMQKLIERSLPEKVDDEKFSSCYELFRENYKRNMRNKTAPYDGIIQLLEKLKEAGIKTAVTSNKNDDAVKQLCGDIFGGLLDFSFGVSADTPPKPDPKMVFKGIEAVGVSKNECIFVGDSETDIRTAKNAGLKSIGVLWGFRDKNVLENEKADYIVKSPQEILGIL